MTFALERDIDDDALERYIADVALKKSHCVRCLRAIACVALERAIKCVALERAIAYEIEHIALFGCVLLKLTTCALSLVCLSQHTPLPTNN